MANCKLTDWLVERSDQLNLQVKRFGWTREWGFENYSDLMVSIDVAGRTFVGRGTARGEDFAFLKAGAEAIERAFCGGHNIHSTGVAAHTDEAQARANAMLEFYERDAFFCHFYTKMPFQPIDGAGIFQRTQKLAARGISVRLYRAQSTRNAVVACVASGLAAEPPWGGIVGLGSEQNENQAIEKAFLECMRNVSAAVLNGPRATLDHKEFNKISKPTSSDRQRLSMNVDYWNQIALFPNTIGANRIRELPPLSLVLQRLSSPYAKLNDAPLIVCRATLSDSLDDKPTLRRLSEFVGRAVLADELESLPHFLG